MLSPAKRFICEKIQSKNRQNPPCHRTSAIFMKFHEAKDCGILFGLLLSPTNTQSRRYLEKGFMTPRPGLIKFNLNVNFDMNSSTTENLYVDTLYWMQRKSSARGTVCGPWSARSLVRDVSEHDIIFAR